MVRLRNDAGYSEFRKQVLERDGKCMMPCCESTHQLVVHHIYPYSKNATLRTNVANGITLCRKCHKKTFGKEKKYAAIFLKLLAKP
jgi:5-methylcytosine-specific restriction endonuclease McrA